MDALEEDHDFLTAGDVFTDDLIETWIDLKRGEIDQARLQPTRSTEERYPNEKGATRNESAARTGHAGRRESEDSSYGQSCTAPLTLFGAVTPGFEGILNAFWLFAGPLAAIIIRKPPVQGMLAAGRVRIPLTGSRERGWRHSGR